MKAIVLSKYGGPESLRLEDVEKPTPAEGEVLIRVVATAINDYDWSLMRGKPYVYRLMFGIVSPKTKIPGMELSGVVEALGATSEKFKIGDAVYGDISDHGFGSFAEYICISESCVELKPKSISFDIAASIPHASMLAVQGLIDLGCLQKKQRVLINGAGGGVGSYALYIAKSFDAEVTGVDTGVKLNKMTSMGFDHVIDFRQQDFTQNGQKYDLILDAKTNRSIFRIIRSLSRGGRYISVGGDLNRLLVIVLLKRWISKFYGHTVEVVNLRANKDLTYIENLYELGKIVPNIEGPYRMSDIPWLVQYFGEGKHTGKIVVNIERTEESLDL
ncbi:NAD(P)-dependent alcohol dehydrogenase [Arenicella sp. 4NH20-0111]|uniref:NAD(P)-dependent alcohol dehydrogenase n=1 Tax=Arenicella sp. 4NH20-0111 TaxID=3127648 RepID=UPI00310AC85D